MSEDRFPKAILALSKALHHDGINPLHMEVLLPREEWRRLHHCIKMSLPLGVWDTLPPLRGEFLYLGITFRAKPHE